MCMWEVLQKTHNKVVTIASKFHFLGGSLSDPSLYTHWKKRMSYFSTVQNWSDLQCLKLYHP